MFGKWENKKTDGKNSWETKQEKRRAKKTSTKLVKIGCISICFCCFYFKIDCVTFNKLSHTASPAKKQANLPSLQIKCIDDWVPNPFIVSNDSNCQIEMPTICYQSWM